MNKIIVYRDETCDMVMVTLNGECIKEGNVWDYHDGCNGDADVYGRYRDLEHFITAIESKYNTTCEYREYEYGVDEGFHEYMCEEDADESD